MTTDAVVVDVSEDWAIASGVQQRVLQNSKPAMSALSYSARCRQAREIGGDFYDFVPLPGNRLALAIGDASGKSIPAALMIFSVHASLRTAASFAGDDARFVLRTVNSQLQAISTPDRYATLFYGVFDGNTRTLRYVNAGHNPPIVIRKDGSTAPLETGGVPVGMFPNWEYQEGAVNLCPGDLLIAYTDGITETTNTAGEEWAIEGLLKAIGETDNQTPDGITSSIFTAMDDFSCGRQTDDATILVARVN